MRATNYIVILGLAAAACPNGCSGNGICGANNKCSCHQNWQGINCALRTCTFSLSGVDTGDDTNPDHYYAECGNRGICDRKTGECKCFEGYEGNGCHRSTCPKSSSNNRDDHAGYEYDRRTGPGNDIQDLLCALLRQPLSIAGGLWLACVLMLYLQSGRNRELDHLGDTIELAYVQTCAAYLADVFMCIRTGDSDKIPKRLARLVPMFLFVFPVEALIDIDVFVMAAYAATLMGTQCAAKQMLYTTTACATITLVIVVRTMHQMCKPPRTLDLQRYRPNPFVAERWIRGLTRPRFQRSASRENGDNANAICNRSLHHRFALKVLLEAVQRVRLQSGVAITVCLKGGTASLFRSQIALGSWASVWSFLYMGGDLDTQLIFPPDTPRQVQEALQWEVLFACMDPDIFTPEMLNEYIAASQAKLNELFPGRFMMFPREGEDTMQWERPSQVPHPHPDMRYVEGVTHVLPPRLRRDGLRATATFVDYFNTTTGTHIQFTLCRLWLNGAVWDRLKGEFVACRQELIDVVVDAGPACSKRPLCARV